MVNPQASLLAAKLHSKYRPQTEADRYINALTIRPDADCFIAVEPALGYIVQSLLCIRPESTVVVLHAESSFRDAGVCPDVPAWYPDSGNTVQEFLEGAIPESASVQIIEWKPSATLFGDAYLGLVRECAEFIRRAAASRRTAAAFGRRWVRNFFRSLTIIEKTLLYKAADVPVVITGSGPGLEAALPGIRSCREGIFLMAASSSLPALASGGIAPDLAIATDGGGWALLHMHACFRGASPPAPMKLAMGLTAAIPSQCASLPVLAMSDGSLWQNIALNAAGIPSAYIPQRGTVTASALELAMVLSGGNIFLAGMDLSVRDIRSHARPYGFDHVFYGAASRFRPVYSQLFARSGDIQAGGSYDVYAAWFNSRVASMPGRVFSLGASSAALPEKDLAAGGGQKDGMFRVIAAKGPPEERRAIAADTLIAALGNPQYAAALRAELAPLLFPSQPEAPAGEIADALRTIARR